MAVEKDNAGRYAWGGVVVLCLLILLGWFAFRGSSPVPTQPTAKIELPKPRARRDAAAFEPTEDSSNEEMAAQPAGSAMTNAADLYHQAFALFDALTKDQQFLLGGWRTNVDASLETEMCDKLRPICDLLHQASTVMNCDWGIEPITAETRMMHLQGARNISRAALWNAVHCRSSDVAGATADAVAVLRLGHNISPAAVIGCLVDQAIQGLAASCVAENVGLFSGADARRLAVAFSDPTYEQAPSRALEQEADMHDRYAAKLAAMSSADAEKEFSDSAKQMAEFEDGYPTNLNQAVIVAAYIQNADSERELAKALASSSEDAYEAWQQHATELEASDPLAKSMLQMNEAFMKHVRYAEIDRALVVAGLAVAQDGVDALQSHPDPSTGEAFAYAETADGFQLQSTSQPYGKPMTMQFKLR